MKNELIKLLGLDLPANATDADSDKAILAAVQTLVTNDSSARAAVAEDATLNKMITDSHGALTREAARQVLKNREAYAASQQPQPKLKYPQQTRKK